MDQQSFARVRSIFERAAELTGAAREAYLRDACGDASVRRDVDALLAAHDASDGFLSTPAMGVLVASALESQTASQQMVGQRLGGYIIRGVLGEGGMGVVYRAEQEHPQRTVALKVIRSATPTPGLLRRFEHEARALARLQHPGIAQIYEAGTAEGPGGRALPFFAMEHVDGTRLLEFAKSLGVRERLELFARVCDAVQHAHAKGVVHRDLKPANILVPVGEEATLPTSGTQTATLSGGLWPKILDFGVARLLDQDAGATMQTDAGQVVGTLQYMSPEQVSGQPDAVDTRSDVYALGLIVYELLCGQRAYSLHGMTIPQAAQVIATQEVAAPSVHDATLRGELDTIVLKALEKEPQRRYQSALELSADVRRYLAALPISAKPPTAMYQARKFAQRNTALVGGVVAAGVLLVLGIVGTSMGMVQARASQRLAEQREGEARLAAKTSERTAKFMTDMLGAIDPIAGGKRDVTVREVLDAGAADMQRSLADEPEVQIEARLTLGSSYVSLSEFEKGEAMLGPALQAARKLAPGGSVREARVLMAQAKSRMEARKFEEAVELAKQGLAMLQAHAPKDQERIAMGLAMHGTALSVAIRHKEAVEVLTEAVAAYEPMRAEHPQAYVDSLMMLAGALSNSGQEDAAGKAMGLYVRALEAQRSFDATQANIASTLHNYANFLFRQAKPKEAEPIYREALEIREKVLGPESHNTLGTRRMLASTLTNAGKLEEAEVLHAKVVEDTRRVQGAGVELSRSLAEFGELKRRMNKLDEAETLILEAIEVARPVNQLQMVDAQRRLGSIYVSRKQPEKAVPLYREYVRMHRERGGTSSSYAGVLSDFGQVLLLTEAWGEAEQVLLEAREMIYKATQNASTRGKVSYRLGLARFKLGRLEEALPLMREGCDLLKGDPQSKGMLEQLAALLVAMGKPEEAAKAREEAGKVPAKP